VSQDDPIERNTEAEADSPTHGAFVECKGFDALLVGVCSSQCHERGWFQEEKGAGPHFVSQ
jgi:hypothetical protein